MSNFLRSLIARTSLQTPVMQRRQAALFEPTAPWSRSPSPTFESSGDVAVEARSGKPSNDVQLEGIPRFQRNDSEISPLPARLTTAETRQVEATPTNSSIVRNTSVVRPIVAKAAPVEVGSEPHRGKANMPALAKEKLSQDVPSVAKDPPRRLAAVSRKEVQAQQSSVETPKIPNNTAAAIASPGSSRMGQAIQLAKSERPRGVNASTSPKHLSPKESLRQIEADTSVLIPTAPRITQAVQLAKATSPQVAIKPATINAEQPSVQVTIGRVEVRAITGIERPAAAAARPATPRLTLDDYLRERSGGRR